MLGYLILAFTVIPMVELYLLIRVGGEIGLFNTIGIVLITGILGAALARREGLRTIAYAQQKMQQGAMPTDSIIDGLLILLAAGVLLTPGFLTDAIGFALLIPPVRAIARRWLKNYFGSRIQTSFHAGPSMNGDWQNPFDGFTQNTPPPSDKPDIIITPNDNGDDESKS